MLFAICEQTKARLDRCTLVGEETLHGVPVKHYVLDGDAFLAAAQESSEPNLREFGEALWSAEDADLYVEAEGGYPVVFFRQLQRSLRTPWL